MVIWYDMIYILVKVVYMIVEFNILCYVEYVMVYIYSRI